ncbi:hypothetical protein R5W23_003679 [Gemmata sp. JC673]|uniref:Uncharacterized protein n=2 Tax=Gemmata algarum TaxID=2975278 RepID=A0ABU5F639_9BACT|nr:hypothetical protein [Gemmata algarum]MDY3562217.1 hypothetical protein [Gemmata algarum]
MEDLTLEALAKRVEALEKKLAERPVPGKMDWLKVVGMFDADPEFMQQVIAEGDAVRESERKAAREGAE